MRPRLPSRALLHALILTLAVGVGCRTVPAAPDAESIVTGIAGPGVHVDSVDDPFTVRVEGGRWKARTSTATGGDFWTEIGSLELTRAAGAARSMEERTFVAALERLLAGDPDAAAVAFGALHRTAGDPLVRARSRVGLTMALSWSSEWAALAALPPDPDSIGQGEPRAVLAAVERWASAFAGIPPVTITMPEGSFTVPLRRSAFGTPVITVLVNGRPREFWLDTGASMSLLSADVALDAGVRLASPDTLALGVVVGHIDARAVYVDSLAIGGFVARGLTAAVVDRHMLRLDRTEAGGVTRAVQIDGVVGTDLLRHMDVVIDAGAGTVTIRRPRRVERATRNLFWLGYPVVRLVSRDGKSLLFGLDTGAEGSYFTTSLLRKLPRTSVSVHRGRISGLGAGGTNTQWVARELRVSDGDHAIVFRNSPIAPERRWTFLTIDGIIGSDVAIATRLHMDFTNGIFDVRPSQAGEKPPSWADRNPGATTPP